MDGQHPELWKTHTQKHKHTDTHKSTVKCIGTQGPNEGKSTLSQGLLHRELNDEDLSKGSNRGTADRA